MTAAMFEIVTKIVDGSRKRPYPEVIYMVAPYLLWIFQILYDVVKWCWRHIHKKRS